MNKSTETEESCSTNQNNHKNKIINSPESWTTVKCDNLNDDFDLVIENIKSLKSIDSSQILMIKVVTSKDINELNTINLKKLQQKVKDKSIVIFIGQEDNKKYLIYWKSKDIRQILFLNAYKESFGDLDKCVCEFAADFLVHSLQNGYIGINADYDISSSKGKVELHLLVDSRNYNLFLLAAESGNLKPIKTLLKYGIETQLPESDVTAQSLAWNGRHFDVLVEFLKASFPFPLQIDIVQCSEELKSFIEASEEFHRMIEDGNKDRLDEILRQYPNLRYFYNISNESALKVALDLNLMEIFEHLVSRNLLFGPHEDINGIFDCLRLEERENIYTIYGKHSKDLPEKHINVLMANTNVISNETEDNSKFSMIHEIYKKFNKDPRLKIILKIVAATNLFKIVFNFCHDSLTDIPGSSQSSRRIEVPAKDLLNQNTESKTYGKLAHELCHYALHAVYGNKANPYTKLDREAEKKFQKILNVCRQNKDTEESIKNVYENYGKNEQPSELIVRPAQLIAMYIHLPEILQEIIKKYPELFNHFEKIVIAEMERALTKIEERFVDKPSYVFSKLSVKNKVKVKNTLVMFKNVKVKFSELFPENSTVFELLTSDHIYKLLKNDDVNLDDSQFQYLQEQIIFKWKNLTENLKDKFLNSDLNFQGHFIKFKSLFDLYSEAFHALTSQQIIKVLSGDDIVIGDSNECKKSFVDEENICEFYVERKIIPEDAKLIYFEYETKNGCLDDEIVQNEHPKNIKISKSFQEYYPKFVDQDFDNSYENLKKIRKNPDFKNLNYNLNDEEFQFLHKNSCKIIEQAESDRILLLSSESGTGKASTFRHLLTQVKKKYPVKWVSYVDVRNLTNVMLIEDNFENFENNFGHSEAKSRNFVENSEHCVKELENSQKFTKNSEKFDENSENHDDSFKYNKNEVFQVCEKIMRKILNLNSENSEFELNVFKEFFGSGNIIQFWDHFDELSKISNQNFINFIKFIHKNTSCVQFISSSPSNSSKLNKYLRIRTWELLPFDNDNKREFLIKYFNSQKISNDKMEENIKEVEKLIENFNSNDVLVYNFDTPIMLKLLSKSDENGNVENYSQIYKTFDSFIDKKIETWLSRIKIQPKSDENSNLKDSIKINFQKYALLNEFHIFASTTLGLKMKKLQIFQKQLPQNLTIEKISSMKILKNNSKFIHKTFSEFFLAQYFIENILNVSSYVDINEAELRLELFYHLMQNYGNLQQVITDFMISYLKIRNQNKKKFNPTISILLRTKFKNFFIRMLDTNHPKVFEFLIEFFKSDHGLLIDLLHVHEDETFYTAIFNPNYFGLSLDPENIRKLVKNCLTEDEFESFVNGKNQKGKIMFGVHFYKLLGITKCHDTYGSKFEDACLQQWRNNGIINEFEASGTSNTVDHHSEANHAQQNSKTPSFDLPSSKNSADYWKFLQKFLKPQNFIQKIFTNPEDETLTENDQKEIFMTAIIPKIYLFYDNLFSTADFIEYKKLWTNFENLLTKSEMQEAIGNAIINYFEICPDNKDGHDMFLYLLLKKARKFLSNSHIFEIFMSKNILHEALWDSRNFKILWNFISERTSKEERKQILLHDDLGDKNFYFFSLLNEPKDKFSSHKYVYYYYDFTALKIIHRTMTTGNAPAFECVTEIYEKYLTKNEIQEIMLKSTDFFLYLIGKSNEKSCEEFVNYLEKLFNGNEKLLIEFLDRKIQPTSLSIFEFVEDCKELPGSKPKWLINLKILCNLYEKIKVNNF